MEQSRCPDCNAVIGGGGHISAPGNTPANDFLHAMSRVQL
jgi:hypothetical protein